MWNCSVIWEHNKGVQQGFNSLFGGGRRRERGREWSEIAIFWFFRGDLKGCLGRLSVFSFLWRGGGRPEMGVVTSLRRGCADNCLYYVNFCRSLSPKICDKKLWELSTAKEGYEVFKKVITWLHPVKQKLLMKINILLARSQFTTFPIKSFYWIRTYPSQKFSENITWKFFLSKGMGCMSSNKSRGAEVQSG